MNVTGSKREKNPSFLSAQRGYCFVSDLHVAAFPNPFVSFIIVNDHKIPDYSLGKSRIPVKHVNKC